MTFLAQPLRSYQTPNQCRPFLLWMYFVMFFLWVFTICFFWKMIGPDEVQWQRIFGMLVCMDEEVWAPMWFMKVNKRPVSRGFRWVLTFYHVQTAVLFAGKRSKTWHPTCNGGLHGAGGSGQWSQIWSTWRPSSLCVTKLNQIGKAKGHSNAGCGEGVSVLCYSIRFFL